MFNNFYANPYYYQGVMYYQSYQPVLPQEIAVVNHPYYPQYAAACQQPPVGYQQPQQQQIPQPTQVQQPPQPPVNYQPQQYQQYPQQQAPAPCQPPCQFPYAPNKDLVGQANYNGTQAIPPNPREIGNNRPYVVATGQNVNNGAYTDERYQNYENLMQSEEAYQKANCTIPENELANNNVRHEDKIRPSDRIKFYYLDNVKILTITQRFWSYLIPCMNHANKFSRNIMDPLLFGALDRLVIQIIKANEEEKLSKAIQLWCNCFYTMVHIEVLVKTLFDTNCIVKTQKKEVIASFLFQMHSIIMQIISTKQQILNAKNGVSLDPNKLVKQETINTIPDENREKVQLKEIAYIDQKWLDEHREEVINGYMA